MLRFYLPHDCQIEKLPASEIPTPEESKESKPIAFVSSTDSNYQLYNVDSAKHIIEFKTLSTNLKSNFAPSKVGLTFFVEGNKLISIHSPRWVDFRMEVILDCDAELKPLPSTIEMGDQVIQSNIIATNADFWT